MSFRFHRPPNRAFTIVELLLVISLIVLLISMTLPSLGQAKETARRAVCAANSRSQVQACDVYSNDNSGFFPSSFDKDGTWAYSFDLRTSSTAVRKPLGVGACIPGRYIGMEPKVFHCPSMDTSGATQWNTPYHSMDVDIPNWWSSIGASWWSDPLQASKRITIAYSYRAPSWYLNSTSKHIRHGQMNPGFVVNVDIMDPRFGKWYTHKQGFTFTRMDESTSFRGDRNDEFETLSISMGVNTDGINGSLKDELLFKKLETGQ
ncbi:MAG: hypothetical protein WD768_04340 [Phycisphaeraceae bacterium]